MFEGKEAEPENTGVEEEVGSRGGEGRRNAEASPPIGRDAKQGQTAAPAPDDDVGVPPDEEMNRPEE